MEPDGGLMPLIELEGVHKSYLPGPVEAVVDVSLRIREGEVLTVLGPSGCGKTTLLRLIAGFEAPDRGRVSVEGRVVADDGAWVPPERRGVGMVFQEHSLFPHLTVGENVTFGLRGGSAAARRERAREVLEVLDLHHHADRYPHELSGGQQQRVALARALAPEPVVVLLDEPFSNLDAHLRESVRDEVSSILRRAGMTSILVSHDQRDALAVSDRVAVMNQGRIEQVGSPREIYKHPESIFVATFVGRTNLLSGVITGPRGCVLTDFGAFCRVDRSGLPEGTEVLVAVRPEGFEPAEDGGLEGTVRSTTYTGSTLEAVVEVPSRLGGGRELMVHLPPHGDHEPGDPVRLAVVSDYASVVRNACQTLGFADGEEAGEGEAGEPGDGAPGDEKPAGGPRRQAAPPSSAAP